MQRPGEYDPDEAPRSALGEDVTFDAPPSYRSAGSVQMGRPSPQAVQIQPKPVKEEAPFEWRKPSMAEERKAFHDLFFKINLHRMITMSNDGVIAGLKQIDGYVAAHSDGNGERSEQEIQQNINRGFWTYIVQDEAKGKKTIVAKEPAAEKPAKKKAKKKPARKVVIRKVKPADAKRAQTQIDGDVFQN